MPRPDPTRPLSERTPEEVATFIDDHIITALHAADLLNDGGMLVDDTAVRTSAENYVRDRLVALSDTYESPEALADEDRQRRYTRLLGALLHGEAKR